MKILPCNSHIVLIIISIQLSSHILLFPFFLIVVLLYLYCFYSMTSIKHIFLIDHLGYGAREVTTRGQMIRSRLFSAYFSRNKMERLSVIDSEQPRLRKNSLQAGRAKPRGHTETNLWLKNLQQYHKKHHNSFGLNIFSGTLRCHKHRNQDFTH